MMSLIAKNIKKQESSTRFKNRLYSFDKSEASNLNLPESIANLSNKDIDNLIKKIITKYKNNNYTFLQREELEVLEDFSDFEVLILILFYKKQFSINISNQKQYFPPFVFTYNLKPLKNVCNKIISYTYDKIDCTLTKGLLKNRYTFNTLQVTYLLHYLVISDINYKEEN